MEEETDAPEVYQQYPSVDAFVTATTKHWPSLIESGILDDEFFAALKEILGSWVSSDMVQRLGKDDAIAALFATEFDCADVLLQGMQSFFH